ncbi:hypothetical protein EBZ35_03090 [bacterium]|nr:hypothetical protein [bacterium]
MIQLGRVDSFLSALNPAQLQAATHRHGPMLVVAGAGSGKTNTLVSRVAYLVSEGIDPRQILLLTFTKKSAQDMMHRAMAIGGDACLSIAGGTFHSVANMLLRVFAPSIGFDPAFTILDRSDADDFIGVVRSGVVARTEKRFPKKGTIGNMISKAINTGHSLDDIVRSEYPVFSDYVADIRLIAESYTDRKQTAQVMDYDDLLLFFRSILSIESIAEQLNDQYRYVMIDEYQDTNHIQGDIVRALGRHGNIMAVGDDAQSIYGFRGADIQNILGFPQQFPGTQVVTLDQNYRSTQPILDLTNAVISQAKQSQFAKVLFTTTEGGSRPLFIDVPDDRTQSMVVKNRVLALIEEGVSLNDMAVLVRNGFNANDLEITLNTAGIPFQKFGGFKFIETAHIKDVLAYLRLMQNPRDELSWGRVLSLIEGVGPKAVATLLSHLSAQGTIQWDGWKKKSYAPDLETLIRLLASAPQWASPLEAVNAVLSVYLPLFQVCYDDHARRMTDLDSLRPIAARYHRLSDFLSDMSLDPPDSSKSRDGGEVSDERLTISTIHSAKGLEWKVVFLLSMVDGVLPSVQSGQDEASLEEERRLLYVALTRAKRQLMIIKPQLDMLGASRQSGVTFTETSRFLAADGLLDAYTDRMVLKESTAQNRKWMVPTPLATHQQPRKKYFF